MGTSNFGNQNQFFDFKNPGKSESFNGVNYKLHEKGIYEGGNLTYNDATHVDIAPLVCYITDTASKVGVKIETTTSVTLEVSSGAPFIIARFSWGNTENNYMDILSVSFASILTDDLIIGRCLYPSGALSATFDYARKSTALTIVNKNKKTDLTVVPTEPFSDMVYVYGGTFFNSEKMIEVTGTNSPAFVDVNNAGSNDITDARIDLVYIDDAGAIQIEQGVDEVSPTAPKYNSRKVIAEVYLDNSNTYIDGTDITLVESITDLSDDAIDSKHINWGTGTGQVNIESIVDPISGLKYFPVYKNRLSTNGLIPFGFSNAISKTTYADLYAEIGDIFEDQHVQAGDAASGASDFYPTPIPGQYVRGGTQDSSIINSTDDIDDSTELITLTTADYDALHMTRGVLGTGADGVPVRLKLISGAVPTGLSVDTTYFINFGTTPDISLHATELDAISDISPIDLTDAVGTFQITQEGVYFDDAMQQITGDNPAHLLGALINNEGGSGAFTSTSEGRIASTTAATAGRGLNTLSFNSADSPDARTSNETRTKTTIGFGYIKANYVL